MAPIIAFHTTDYRRQSCEAVADEIIARIPALAECRKVPPGCVAEAVWLGLLCDLVGNEQNDAKMNALFERGRHMTRRARLRS